jgi:hypothetical protein
LRTEQQQFFISPFKDKSYEEISRDYIRCNVDLKTNV